MPFAVHLFFDPTSESVIQNVWQELAQHDAHGAHGAHEVHRAVDRPHLTLVLYDELDIGACADKLKLFAEMSSPFPLTISHLGIFPTEKPFVFLALTVTQKLLDIQAYMHQLLGEIGQSSLTNYVPGCWVPHCTLALDVDAKLIAQVIEIGLTMPFPIHCRIEEIGVVECSTVQQICSFQLRQVV